MFPRMTWPYHRRRLWMIISSVFTATPAISRRTLVTTPSTSFTPHILIIRRSTPRSVVWSGWFVGWEQTIYCERFSLKITNKSCYKRLNIANLWGRKIKESALWKKIILKDILNINTKILELVVCVFTHPVYSVLVHPQNVEVQYR